MCRNRKTGGRNRRDSSLDRQSQTGESNSSYLYVQIPPSIRYSVPSTMNPSLSPHKLCLRIGNGYDVHQLVPGRPLFLGGVKIPHHKGALAHSDGDVLIHALCDALLGAAALGDIGQHFPDSSPEYKDIDSKILLSRTVALLRDKGFEPVNIDAVICLQSPKIAPFIPQMRAVLAQILDIPEEAVSVKATTTESLGFVGREEGVAVYVVCLIRTLA